MCGRAAIARMFSNNFKRKENVACRSHSQGCTRNVETMQCRCNSLERCACTAIVMCLVYEAVAASARVSTYAGEQGVSNSVTAGHAARAQN